MGSGPHRPPSAPDLGEVSPDRRKLIERGRPRPLHARRGPRRSRRSNPTSSPQTQRKRATLSVVICVFASRPRGVRLPLALQVLTIKSRLISTLILVKTRALFDRPPISAALVRRGIERLVSAENGPVTLLGATLNACARNGRLAVSLIRSDEHQQRCQSGQPAETCRYQMPLSDNGDKLREFRLHWRLRLPCAGQLFKIGSSLT